MKQAFTNRKLPHTGSAYRRIAILLVAILSGVLPIVVPAVRAQGPSPQDPPPRDAQRLLLSSRADFSTNDRLFRSDDTLFVRVLADGFVGADEATVALEPAGEGNSVEQALTDEADGTFTAALPLADVASATGAWRVRIAIELGDDELEERARIAVRSTDMPAGITTLTGVVEAASVTSVTVGGQEVAVTAETAIRTPDGAVPALADLVGARVRIVARADADGQGLVASQLIVLGATGRGALTLYGPVTDAEVTDDGTVIVVRGERLLVDASTTLEGVQAPSELAAGMVVKVEAQRAGGASDVRWLALTVSVRATDGDGDEDNGDEEELQELSGVVEAVSEGGDLVTVSGITFAVDAATEFDGFERLVEIEGQSVEVHYRHVPEGAALAVNIEVEDARRDGDGRGDDDHGDDNEEDEKEVEVEGAVTAVGAASVTVGEVEFFVDGETEFEGFARLDDLYTGLVVEAKGVPQDDGSILATEIEVEEELHSERDVKGPVTARTDTSLTIGGRVLGDGSVEGGTTFLVTGETEITGERGAPLTFVDVEVGLFAEAELVETAGELVALKLEVERRFEDDDVEVAGPITAVDAASITVRGLTFALAADVEVTNAEGEPVTAADLQVGQKVEVEGHLAEDGTRVADEIEVRERLRRGGHLRGTVTAADAAAGTFTIEDHVTFQVSAERTRFEDDLTLDGLAGASVRVWFRVLSGEQGDGGVRRLALRVRTADRDSDDDSEETPVVTLSGAVTAISGDVIVVDGVEVLVTTATVDSDGNAIAAADLAEGEQVEVEAQAAASGLEAVRITRQEAVVVSGSVAMKASGTIAVAGADVVFDGGTLIVGPAGETLSPEAFGAGAFVEVFAVASRASETAGKNGGDGSPLYAERVEVLSVQAGTGRDAGDGASDLPRAVALEQNYPNPFNPTTTITFTVEPGETVRATLEVYNLLGQRVRTLAAGPHTSGTYAYVWNGRDAAGAAVASGVYLYRLTAGSQVETRTMTLVK